jgi:hypothetical protein
MVDYEVLGRKLVARGCLVGLLHLLRGLCFEGLRSRLLING